MAAHKTGDRVQVFLHGVVDGTHCGSKAHRPRSRSEWVCRQDTREVDQFPENNLSNHVDGMRRRVKRRPLFVCADNKEVTRTTSQGTSEGAQAVIRTALSLVTVAARGCNNAYS